MSIDCKLQIAFYIFQAVDQLIADIELWGKLNHGNTRKHFSEIMRLDSYGFQIYQYLNLFDDSTLRFTSNTKLDNKCCQRLSFLRVKHVRIGR